MPALRGICDTCVACIKATIILMIYLVECPTQPRRSECVSAFRVCVTVCVRECRVAFVCWCSKGDSKVRLIAAKDV